MWWLSCHGSLDVRYELFLGNVDSECTVFGNVNFEDTVYDPDVISSMQEVYKDAKSRDPQVLFPPNNMRKEILRNAHRFLMSQTSFMSVSSCLVSEIFAVKLDHTSASPLR